MNKSEIYVIKREDTYYTPANAMRKKVTYNEKAFEDPNIAKGYVDKIRESIISTTKFDILLDGIKEYDEKNNIIYERRIKLVEKMNYNTKMQLHVVSIEAIPFVPNKG